MKKYKIPKCHECGEEITEVYESVRDKYFFHKETGKYEGFGFGGEPEVTCANCGAILDIFKKEVYNYQVEENKQ